MASADRSSGPTATFCRNLYWKLIAMTVERWLGVRTEASMLSLFLGLPLSREQEFEADLVAITLMRMVWMVHCYEGL
jgi:hypothetical protein